MSNKFNIELALSEIIKDLKICGEVQFNPLIGAISDPGRAVSNSICEYIKGPLPNKAEGLILLVSEAIVGFDCLVVSNPKFQMIQLINYIKSTIGFVEEYKNSIIPESVIIGKNVVIDNDVEIGENTVIEHNVIINSGTRIGNNCIIRSNSCIGGEGYGFIRYEDKPIGVPSIGGVYIGDNVEIGYNCAVSKGNINDTIIADYVKFDAMNHVAHDCNIGEEATITASVAFCGYVTIGKRTRVAPNATIKQRVTVGSDVVIGVGAVVLADVKDNETMFGNPARRTFTSK